MSVQAVTRQISAAVLETESRAVSYSRRVSVATLRLLEATTRDRIDPRSDWW